MTMEEAQMSQLAVHYRPGTHSRGEDTRRRILEAAIEAFAAEGYEAVGTRRLAEQAGVNLPAIQYYFGSKEGLYRAVIEHVIRQMEERMGPVAARVDAALAHRRLPRKEILALLCEMLDAFVAHVGAGEHRESKRLLFARAEIEKPAALDSLHESAMRQIFQPCAALIGRLVNRTADEEFTLIRTLLILGQVVMFCNKGAQLVLKWSDFDEDRVRAVQALVREHTMAIFGAAAAQRRERTPTLRPIHRTRSAS